MTKKIIVNLIALALIGFALLPKLTIPNIIPPTPSPSINLNVEKPTDEILKLVQPISQSITNKEDRINIAAFNYVFSKRLMNYNIDSQKLNDVYVLAGENFFEDSLVGKYSNLADSIENLFVSVLGDKNHILSEDEKINLKNIVSGLAWSLIQ